MPVLEDGTMRETMDELGNTNVSVAVDSYQRVVREYHPPRRGGRLRKILLERDTGIPTDPDTVLPKNRNI